MNEMTVPPNSNLVNRSKWTINRTRTRHQLPQSDSDKVAKVVAPDANKKLNNNNNNKSKARQANYCLFYNRFGRCSRGDQCTFVHDPKRVAVCPR